MARRKRLGILVAVGVALCAAAVFAPLGAVVVPTWHHHLTVTARLPDEPAGVTLRLCVSEFEVMPSGVLSFRVEERASYMDNFVPYLGAPVGKKIVLPAEEFVLYENNELCSRSN